MYWFTIKEEINPLYGKINAIFYKQYYKVYNILNLWEEWHFIFYIFVHL